MMRGAVRDCIAFMYRLDQKKPTGIWERAPMVNETLAYWDVYIPLTPMA